MNEDIQILLDYAKVADCDGAVADSALRWYIVRNDTASIVEKLVWWLQHNGPRNGLDVSSVIDFLDEFEDAAELVYQAEQRNAHATLPNALAREVIGNAIGLAFALPEDLRDVEFQVRKSSGQPCNINLEDHYTVGNISKRDAEAAGLTLADIVAVLQWGDARERKKLRAGR